MSLILALKKSDMNEMARILNLDPVSPNFSFSFFFFFILYVKFDREGKELPENENNSC